MSLTWSPKTTFSWAIKSTYSLSCLSLSSLDLFFLSLFFESNSSKFILPWVIDVNFFSLKDPTIGNQNWSIASVIISTGMFFDLKPSKCGLAKAWALVSAEM